MLQHNMTSPSDAFRTSESITYTIGTTENYLIIPANECNQAA